MDIRRALLVLQRWWPILVAGTLIAAIVAYGVSKALPKVYEATALLQVNSGLGTTNGGVDFNALQAAWHVASDETRLISTADVASAAINQVQGKLSKPVDPGTLLNNTKVQAASESSLVTVIVHANNPNDAELLANALAGVAVQRANQGGTAGVTQALTKINDQIVYYNNDALHAQKQSGTLSAERYANDQNMLVALQQTQQGLLLRLDDAGTVLVSAQAATVPTSPISPRTSINTLIAAILVLLVLLGLAFLIDTLDTRPRSAAEVAERLELPLLGTIDATRANATLITVADPLSASADEYRAARANLRMGTAEREAGAPGVMLIVSGLNSGDGTTTVAANLAVTTARGGKQVIVLDANLRRPAVHTLFNLSERPGLTALLHDEAAPETFLIDSGVPGLRLLTAGTASAEAIDLLGSARMDHILNALRAICDLLVVDAPPVDSADTATVATRDGAVVVVTRQQTAIAERLQAVERLRAARARLAGVIVTQFGPATVRRAAAPTRASQIATDKGRPGPADARAK